MATRKPFDVLRAEIGHDPESPGGQCVSVFMRVEAGSEALAACRAIVVAGSGRLRVDLLPREGRWYGQHVETLSDQLDPENMRVLGVAAWTDQEETAPTHFASIRIGDRGTKVHTGRWLNAVRQYVPMCPSDGSSITVAEGETVTCRICLHLHPAAAKLAEQRDPRRHALALAETSRTEWRVQWYSRADVDQPWLEQGRTVGDEATVREYFGGEARKGVSDHWTARLQRRTLTDWTTIETAEAAVTTSG